MIDFKNPKLFQREQKKFEKFLNEKLFTHEEYSSRVNISDQTMTNAEIVDMESFLGGSPIDILGEGQDEIWGNDTFGDEGEGGRKRHVDIQNERLHETGVWWKDILFAPAFLIWYVCKSMVYDFPTKSEWIDIFKAIQKVSMVTAVVSIFLWVVQFHFIFSFSFQTVAAILMFGLSSSMVKWLEGKDNTEGEEDSGGLEGGNNGDLDMDFDFLADNLSDDNVAFDLDGENLSLDNAATSFDFNSLFETPIADEIENDVNPNKYNVLKPSNIDIGSADDFERTLMDAFVKAEKYQGKAIYGRRDLIESFHEYVVTNDKSFGSWRTIKPHSVEWKNIAYALFKGLGQIDNRFLTDEEPMIIYDIKSNPLLFKIEVELPNYFKESSLNASKMKEIESILKSREDDVNIQVIRSYYQGIFIFKFLVLEIPKLISLGDILRFYDEEKGTSPIESFSDENRGLPVLIGLLNNEYPHIIDMEQNTCGVIVGGSGSGKSWTTFLVLFNLVLANDYNTLNFVIFDLKAAPFWNQFARFPHVLGYHYDPEKYLEQMRELYEEVNRRKQLQRELNEENLSDYRKRLRKAKDYDKLKQVPILYIIVDEITSTMKKLESYYNEKDDIQSYHEFRSLMANISQEGRSLGVRLLVIGQRAIDKSVPRDVLANSTFKFAMKMDAESDFEILLGKEGTGLPKPYSKGLGLLKIEGTPGIQSIRTLTVGGADEYQIVRLIRVLALDWVRRSIGREDENLFSPPNKMNIPLCFNRDKFYQESLDDLEAWRILSQNEETKYGHPDKRFSQPSEVFEGQFTEMNQFPAQQETMQVPTQPSVPMEQDDDESFDFDSYDFLPDDFSSTNNIREQAEVTKETTTYSNGITNFSTETVELPDSTMPLSNKTIPLSNETIPLSNETITLEDFASPTETVDTTNMDVMDFVLQEELERGTTASVPSDKDGIDTVSTENAVVKNPMWFSEKDDSDSEGIGIDDDELVDLDTYIPFSEEIEELNEEGTSYFNLKVSEFPKMDSVPYTINPTIHNQSSTVQPKVNYINNENENNGLSIESLLKKQTQAKEEQVEIQSQIPTEHLDWVRQQQEEQQRLQDEIIRLRQLLQQQEQEKQRQLEEQKRQVEQQRQLEEQKRKVEIQRQEHTKKEKVEQSTTKTQIQFKVENQRKIADKREMYHYILNYGTKIGNFGYQMHRDELLEEFSEEDLIELQKHTHILQEGDYYIATKG